MNPWETKKGVLNALPKIGDSPKTFTLEHTSINGPPFPMTNKSKTWYFSNRGRSTSPAGKRGALWVPWILSPSIPTRKAQTDQSPQEAQVSPQEQEYGPRLEVRLVGYQITTKASKVYCQSTPSSNRISSLRRWLANDFSSDSLKLKNISSHKPRTLLP